MKQTIALIVILALTACNTTREQRCDTYRKAYLAYQLSTVEREPRKQELAYVRTAVEFLTTYCGWVRTRAVDQYGIPVIKKASK